MKYTAIIEIPKGCDRRIHLNYAKTAFEDFGPIKDKIPINDGVMPVDYGFIEGTHNPDEGDEVDAIVLTNRKLKTEQKLEVDLVALIRRDDKDDKVLVVDKASSLVINKWEDVDEDLRKNILEFFAYGHKIESIESKEKAKEYIGKYEHR